MRASQTTKYAAPSTSSPKRAARTSGRATTRTSNGSRAVRASTAATRPPSDSTGGWMPCASSRRSASRSRTSPASASNASSALRSPRLDLVPGQPQVHHQRDDLLLDAVVDVALDPSALGVRRGHQSGAGPVEFGQPLGELGGQPDVRDGGRRLAGERGQQLAVLQVVPVGLGSALDQPDRLRPGGGPRPGHRRRAAVLQRHREPGRSGRVAGARLRNPREGHPHPGRAEPASDRVRKPRQQVGDREGVFEAGAEVRQQLVPVHRQRRTPTDRRAPRAGVRRGWNASAARIVNTTATWTGI